MNIASIRVAFDGCVVPIRMGMQSAMSMVQESRLYGLTQVVLP